jgi:hypothetical protein
VACSKKLSELQQRPHGQEVTMIENFARELPRFIYTCLAIVVFWEFADRYTQTWQNPGQEQCLQKTSKTPVVKLHPTIVQHVEVEPVRTDDMVVINGKNCAK